MPGSTSRSIRSRAGSLPRERWRSTARLAAARCDERRALAQLLDERGHPRLPPCEGVVADEVGRENGHAVSSVTSTVPVVTCSPAATSTGPHRCVVRSAHDLLHLHRLEHDERLVRRNARSGVDPDVDHLAGHRRGHAAVTARRPGRERRRLDLERAERRRGGEVEAPASVPRAGRRAERRRRERGEPRQEVGREVGVAEGGMGDEPPEEGQVRRHSLDDRLVQRGGQTVERIVAVGAVRHELRDHRVVGGPDLVALLDARVDADRRRKAQPSCDPACGRNVRGSSA